MPKAERTDLASPVLGRWTIRWQPWAGGTPGGYKVGGREPWPGEEPTPVVPCDDAARARAVLALEALIERRGERVTLVELADGVLRAAGETS